MCASAILVSMRHPARLTLENTMNPLNRWARTGAALLLLNTASWIPGAAAQAADMNSPLAGSWTLVAADVLHADGSRGHDYGAAPIGRLLIDRQGQGHGRRIRIGHFGRELALRFRQRRRRWPRADVPHRGLLLPQLGGHAAAATLRIEGRRAQLPGAATAQRRYSAVGVAAAKLG